jgi:hypothetical protein
VIVFVVDDPALTDLSPLLARVKLKALVELLILANQALLSALGVIPFLKAFVLTRMLPVRVNELVYFFDDWVGDVPSVV